MEDVVKPTVVCPTQATPILLCISVTDLLAQVNTGRVTPAMLPDAMARHYAAHVIAYGYTIFVPKHHFMLHIPRQLERFKFFWGQDAKKNIDQVGKQPMTKGAGKF